MNEELQTEIRICTNQIKAEKLAGNLVKEAYWKGLKTGLIKAISIFEEEAKHESQ